MSGFRKPEIPREQLALWSQRLDDALPPDHPVRQVDYLLHTDAFRETFREWEESYVLLEGKPPYHPRYLAGLYLYGMMNRLRSSRQLEAAGYNRLDVIWLLSGQTPDHATIAGFVSRHARSLRNLFRDVLKVSIRAGLVKLEHVAIDGTKIEADAGQGVGASEGVDRIVSFEAQDKSGQAGRADRQTASGMGNEREAGSEPVRAGSSVDAERR